MLLLLLVVEFDTHMYGGVTCTPVTNYYFPTYLHAAAVA